MFCPRVLCATGIPVFCVKMDVSAKIDRLTGIAAGINDNDIAEDDKLAYILGK